MGFTRCPYSLGLPERGSLEERTSQPMRPRAQGGVGAWPREGGPGSRSQAGPALRTSAPSASACWLCLLPWALDPRTPPTLLQLLVPATRHLRGFPVASLRPASPFLHGRKHPRRPRPLHAPAPLCSSSSETQDPRHLARVPQGPVAMLVTQTRCPSAPACPGARVHYIV